MPIGLSSNLILYRFNTIGNDGDGEGSAPVPFGPEPHGRDDLPYTVELWNGTQTIVERVLAVASNGSIGYAAYYAATREHPNRHITLRHRNRIVSRWKGSEH